MNNIVANSEIGREIALNALSGNLIQGEAKCSDSKGCLVYKLDDSSCTINIFRTGKVIIMGVSSIEEVEEMWRRLIEELSRLFVSQNKYTEHSFYTHTQNG